MVTKPGQPDLRTEEQRRKVASALWDSLKTTGREEQIRKEWPLLRFVLRRQKDKP